jgi:hypothetical protein
MLFIIFIFIPGIISILLPVILFINFFNFKNALLKLKKWQYDLLIVLNLLFIFNTLIQNSIFSFPLKQNNFEVMFVSFISLILILGFIILITLLIIDLFRVVFLRKKTFRKTILNPFYNK